MATTLALISDLHANLLALETVLADMERRGIEQLYCLGDVATLGPKPLEVLSRLQELGCRCIMGNHDEFMLDAELIHTYTEAPVVVEAVAWCREQLGDSDLNFIRGFVPSIPLQLEGVDVLLYHGSPKSNMQDLVSTTTDDELDEALKGTSATVLAGGHTHLQMLRQHRGALVLNPGSVGQPFRERVTDRPPTVLPHTEYASVELRDGAVSVQLHRIPLDKAALHAQASEAPDNPITEYLQSCYA